MAVESRSPVVCIDCRYIGPRPSGIAEVVQALVDHVPGMAPDLRFLFLKHPKAPARLSTADNVTEVVVPHAANGPATMWYLPRVVDLSGIDLFHAPHNIMPAGLPVPCVTTVHDVMWLTAPRLCNDRLSSLVDRWFYAHGIKRALSKAAAIATVSAATRDEILRIAPEAADRTTVTLSGVSGAFHPIAAELPWGRIGVPPGQRFVLTVGQYAPYKNHEGAITAFAQAFRDQPGIHLVIVDRRGTGRENLTRLIRRLGIGDRVHFPSPVDRALLVALYNHAIALLHPSFCEGFGNPLAEAMACGCPVITSNVSAMPEVTGGAALLVDPGDHRAAARALLEVANVPAAASALRARGLARAGQLRWEGFAAANLEIYRSLLGQSGVAMPAAIRRAAML